MLASCRRGFEITDPGKVVVSAISQAVKPLIRAFAPEILNGFETFPDND